MAYRNDVEALEARLANLDAEIDDRKRERAEAAALLLEARAHEQAQRSTRSVTRELPIHEAREQRVRDVFVISMAVFAIIGTLLLGLSGGA